jgi:hypothetical protein
MKTTNTLVLTGVALTVGLLIGLQGIDAHAQQQVDGRDIDPADVLLQAEIAVAAKRCSAFLCPRYDEPDALEGNGRVLLHSVICDKGSARIRHRGDRWLLDVTSDTSPKGEFSETRDGAKQFEVGMVVELPIVVERRGRGAPEVQLIYTPLN